MGGLFGKPPKAAAAPAPIASPDDDAVRLQGEAEAARRRRRRGAAATVLSRIAPTIEAGYSQAARKTALGE